MKMSLSCETPAAHREDWQEKGSLARYFLKRRAEIAEVLRLLVEGGDQQLGISGEDCQSDPRKSTSSITKVRAFVLHKWASKRSLKSD